MRTGPAGQIHHRTRNILRHAKSPHGVRAGNLVGAARYLQEPVGHLAREETRADGVYGDAPGTQLDGQVAAEVDDGRLGRRVPIGALLANGANAQAGDAGRDDDAGGVRARSGLVQQRRKDADRVEDGLDIEIHDLGKGLVGVGVKGLAPGGAGVGEENVHAVSVLLDLFEQVRHALHVGRVGGDGDGDGAGRAVGKGIEGFAGLVAGGGFAGRDEDLGGAGLEEAFGAPLAIFCAPFPFALVTRLNLRGCGV